MRANKAQGQPPLHLDSGAPKTPLSEYVRNEARFKVVEKTDPERFKRLLKHAERITRQRYAVYQQLAGITVPLFDSAGAPVAKPAEEAK